MRKAFLTYAQLREYLAMLVDNGLIEYEEGRQTYRTTEKRILLLQIYNQMSDELVIFNNIDRKEFHIKIGMNCSLNSRVKNNLELLV